MWPVTHILDKYRFRIFSSSQKVPVKTDFLAIIFYSSRLHESFVFLLYVLCFKKLPDEPVKISYQGQY